MTLENRLYLMTSVEALRTLKKIEFPEQVYWRSAMWSVYMNLSRNGTLIWLISYEICCQRCSLQQPQSVYYNDILFLREWSYVVQSCDSKKLFEYLLQMGGVTNRFESAFLKASVSGVESDEEVPLVGNYQENYGEVFKCAARSKFWSAKYSEQFLAYQLKV